MDMIEVMREATRIGHLDHSRADWPRADITHDPRVGEQFARALTGESAVGDGPLSLYVKGTNFQVSVWRALLAIPTGELATYGHIAAAIGSPTSARAVGNAIGANPVALVIPCHRVIQQSGAIGGYRWGPHRKRLIQLWEQVQG